MKTMLVDLTSEDLRRRQRDRRRRSDRFGVVHRLRWCLIIAFHHVCVQDFCDQGRRRHLPFAGALGQQSRGALLSEREERCGAEHPALVPRLRSDEPSTAARSPPAGRRVRMPLMD